MQYRVAGVSVNR